jgi:hypothetical protein
MPKAYHLVTLSQVKHKVVKEDLDKILKTVVQQADVAVLQVMATGDLEILEEVMKQERTRQAARLLETKLQETRITNSLE